MSIQLPYLPVRPPKPRETGLTMMMDKGLCIRETENFIEMNAPYTDLVKLGFGTAVVSSNLEKKIRLYQQAGILTYFGGTLFEAFVIRNMFDDYIKLALEYGLTTVEVSDGSMYMHHSKKLEYISQLAKHFKVLSEVGSKQKGVEIPDEMWVEMMKTELGAGSWKVIAEARESGTSGIYHSDGSVNENLISLINTRLQPSDILWEAPTGKQQAWFIKLHGPNVNLGNIAANDVIPLECLRLGLRGDTFFDFLPPELKNYRPGSEMYQQLD
ncbi:MAG TPA: phosphosulfolactate synthase [Bacteroidales bacterium]|nr:phosphosulfolactate synthase [Bacteroidales bacterium]